MTLEAIKNISPITELIVRLVKSLKQKQVQSTNNSNKQAIKNKI